MTETDHFCPQCGEQRPTIGVEVEGKVVVRCQMCGYPVAQPLPEIREEPAGAEGPLILHIDDDPIMRKVVAAHLAKSGFTTIEAPDGTSGLELAQKTKPAAVLLDVMMPDIDGYEVARQLRALPGIERMAIIMLTGTSDLQLNTLAFQSGADLAIRKPFDKRKLVLLIRTALQLKSFQRPPYKKKESPASF